MLAVAGTALWLGGWWWRALVAFVTIGVFWEWNRLVASFSRSMAGRAAWFAGGLVYVGTAALVLLLLRSETLGIRPVLVVVAAVIATDIGAYLVGRTIGGPKIAPAISPSKTWAGLAGGIVGASAVFLAVAYFDYRADVDWLSAHAVLDGLPGPPSFKWPQAILLGAGTAIIAQAGDFFESWMKRRAGVKDSGHLIPGHGGLFDRVDGLLAVLFPLGLLILLAELTSSF
jgi:phosphatidate cytidylyltransferase